MSGLIIRIRRAAIVLVCVLDEFVVLGSTSQDRVVQDALLQFNARQCTFERRLSKVEVRQGEIQSYSAQCRIDFLKSHLDFVLWMFGIFTLGLSVWSVVNIVKTEQLRDAFDKLKKRADDIESKVSSAQRFAEEFNVSHMTYNARLYNSLANVFEHLSDSVFHDDMTLGEFSIRTRSVYFQTVILYYEQAIKYNLESNSYDDLFCPVHNLAAIVQRMEDTKASKIRYHLKSKLLAKHQWLHSPDAIESALKKSRHSVKEISSAMRQYRILLAGYGCGVAESA